MILINLTDENLRLTLIGLPNVWQTLEKSNSIDFGQKCLTTSSALHRCDDVMRDVVLEPNKYLLKFFEHNCLIYA